jgi:tetratricopeptide (TPR) repeat protein
MATILVNRGILYNHMGDYAAAIDDFEAALDLLPNFPEAYINRGNALFYSGQIEQAIADYDRAIQRKSGKQHTAYFNRGLVNETRKQPDLAFADFVRANELKPDWVLAAGRVELYRQHGYELSH